MVSGSTDRLYVDSRNASSTLSAKNYSSISKPANKSFQYSKRKEFSFSSNEDVLQNVIKKKNNTLSKEIDILDVVESNDNDTIETSFVVGERMSVIEKTDDASDDRPIITLEIITNKPLKIKNRILSIKTEQHGHKSFITKSSELEKECIAVCGSEKQQANMQNDSARQLKSEGLQKIVHRNTLRVHQQQFSMKKSISGTIQHEENLERPTDSKNGRTIHIKHHQSRLNKNFPLNYQNHLDFLRKLLIVWSRRLNIWEEHIREKKKKLERLSPANYNSSEKTVMQNRSTSHLKFIYHSNETANSKTTRLTENRNFKYHVHSDGRKNWQDTKQRGQHFAMFHKKKDTKYLPIGKVPQKVIDFFITEESKADNFRASTENIQSVMREMEIMNNGTKAKNKIVTNNLSGNGKNRIHRKYHTSQFHESSSKRFSHRKSLKSRHFGKISKSRQEHDSNISETPPMNGNISSTSYIKYLNQELIKTEHQQNLLNISLNIKKKKLRNRTSSGKYLLVFPKINRKKHLNIYAKCKILRLQEKKKLKYAKAMPCI